MNPLNKLNVSASPHMRAPDDTPTIMWHVVVSLLPIVACATYFFGISALLVITAATVGCLLVERLCQGSDARPQSLRDGSALITGLLLGLCLPPGFPLWMAFIGGAFGIGFGKLIFGGLGQNVFNPALLGRAFLQAAFPVAITTWTLAPSQNSNAWWQLQGDNFAWPLMKPELVDGMSGATPLGLKKFEGIDSSVMEMVLGQTGGSLGETAGLVILLCGAYLAWKNYLNWRIPVSILLTTGLLAEFVRLFNPAAPTAMFMIFSGGLILGAVYMATDMVTSPTTNKGCWIFGIGIGALVVLIRLWGGLPEGVMYAILLMNAFVPFINRISMPTRFGVLQKTKGESA